MVLGRIGWPELVLILVILVFIFGAKRLKDVVRGVGESVREFKEASSEPQSASDVKNDDAIIEAAEKMGIETKGKSIEAILKEMGEKAK